jgi:hypothetical protein
VSPDELSRVLRRHVQITARFMRSILAFPGISWACEGYSRSHLVDPNESWYFTASVFRFIYCSSAGVYLKSDQMPHREEDATDLKSRHKVCLV